MKNNNLDNKNIINEHYEYSDSNLYKRNGIINEGYTCYMNSIIQIIYNIPIFVKYIIEIENKDINNEYYKFIKVLKDILLKLNQNNKPISIKELFKNLKFENNEWNRAQDIYEYYGKILDILITFNKKLKDITYGIISAKIEVNEKNYISEKNEEFLFLELDVENSDNLIDCMKNYFKKEILNGDNQIEINENNKKLYFDGTKEYKIRKLPDMMNILLKRFKFNYEKNFCVKLNNEIKFNEYFDFSPFLDINSNLENKKNKYILFSIMIHSGDYMNGHYFVIIKDFNNNRFYKIDDNKINLINRQEVFKNYCGGFFVNEDLDDNYQFENDCNVYILIYINSKKINDFFDYKYINKYFNTNINKNKNSISSDKNKNVTIIKNNIKHKTTIEDNQKVKNIYTKTPINYEQNKSNNIKNINYNDKSLNSKILTFVNVNKNNTNDSSFTKNSLINRMNKLKYEKSISNNQLKSSIQNKRETNKNYFKYAIINNKIINYNTLKNIQINQYKDINPIYKSCFEHNNNKNISETKFHTIIWNNFTYTNFLLFLNYKLKYQNPLFFPYHKDYIVKNIPFIIYQQIKGFGTKINMNIINRIFIKKQFIIILLNSFGLVIKLLYDMNENIYEILKPFYFHLKNELIIKHICIYYIKNIENYKEIEYIITVNIVKNDIMLKIFDKTYKTENYINSPILIINQKLYDYKTFKLMMESIFIKNLRIDDLNKYKYNIYFIRDIDLIDINITELTIVKVDIYEFLFRIMTLKKTYNKIDYKRFFIAYDLKN